MKLLVIDIGNTNIKCAVIEDGELLQTWHYEAQHAEGSAADLASRAAHLPVVVCSVVPRAETSVLSALKSPVIRISRDSQKEISGLYPGFGADRVADLVGARQIYAKGKNVLVIGLGTATVLTAVSREGEFKGGFITLGLSSTIQALSNRIPQLPNVGLEFSAQALPAFDTISSIRAGALLSQAATVDRWIASAKGVLSGPTVTVATGGWSKTVAPHCQLINHVDSALTLKGAYFIALSALTEKANAG
jgi:type III pantothenate kinase